MSLNSSWQAFPPPPLVVASGAQVEPGQYPGGGYLLVDTFTGSRRGDWYQFVNEALLPLLTSLADIQWGRQPITCCECAILPLVLLREGRLLRG